MKIPVILTGLLFTGLSLSAAVVTTVDNSSPAGDDQTSLLEAITSVNNGETISFNIPGAGPHYIVTPDSGYPVITKAGVTIDGYTQPGSSANTAGIREPNNANLRVVLDSRTTTAGAKRTVLNYPGFGTTESAVISFLDAPAATVRGLAFIGVAGSGSDLDPYVYNTALVNRCPGSRIQGCWFGLDPGVASWAPGPDGAVAGVYGARSAVAAFRGSEPDADSPGLAFGVSTINGSRGEFNICMAQRLAVHLQTPAITVSGNWFNVFPDGSLLNLQKQGLMLEDGTLEAIENGNPLGMRIGTDGNGTLDEDEGNIFGPLFYDVVVECWGSNVGIVFAGNSVGTDLNNLPAFTLPDMGLFAIRRESDLRVGTDKNGSGDAAETNYIHGLGGGFIKWHNNNATGVPAVVNVRGNELIDNYGTIPLDTAAVIQPHQAYAEVMRNPSLPDVTLSPLSGTQTLRGIVPPPAAGVESPVVDVYIADAFGLYRNPPAFQGRTWLASFVMDGPADSNAEEGLFTYDVSALNLTQEEATRITITATYSLTNGRAVTSNFSPTLLTAAAPPALGGLTIGTDPGGVKVQWTGGTGPFGVYGATDPAGPWSLLTTTAAQNVVTPLEGVRRFYRVREGLPPR